MSAVLLETLVWTGVLIALVLVTALALQNNILSENDINDFSGELAEALHFNEAGLPVRVADEEYLWLFESLYSDIAFRVLDQAGKVVLASPAAAVDAAGWLGRETPRVSE